MPLGKDMGAWIEDFQNSKNKKFAGKSKEERTKMAKAAYMAKYGKKKMEEAKLISDYKVGDIISFKDGEDWKVMKVKDNVDKLVIKPYNEKAKKGNVSLEIDIDADYLKKNLKEAKSEDRIDYKKRRENDIVSQVDPNHYLVTKDVEEWDDNDMKEYKKMWDKYHGNPDMKDMLKKAVMTRLKEAGTISPEEQKARDLEIQAQKAAIAAAQHKIQNLQKGDETIAENYDFFEDNMDDDAYVDVSGPSVEMSMEELLAEFEERLKEIPEESRQAGLKAIKTFWIDQIKDWNPNLITPHRAPMTEAKHPIMEVREYDYEGQMARTQLISIVKNAKALFDSISDRTQLQSWVQSKLTKAEDYLNAVRSYLEGESISNTAPLMINNEPAKDDEGTALNVGDVVRAANGGIYQAVHSYSEGKPFLTPFDLKKRKATNLRERHYFDNVSEGEMSITKKMYKVMPHTQTKGGFVK